MKRFVLIIALILFPIVFVRGQIARSWTDSLAVSTSSSDTTFSTQRWETATLIFSGCDGWIKYALSSRDTLGWSDDSHGKKWFYLGEGQTLSITANKELRIPGLWRLEYKAALGSGALFITGTKKYYK